MCLFGDFNALSLVVLLNHLVLLYVERLIQILTIMMANFEQCDRFHAKGLKMHDLT